MTRIDHRPCPTCKGKGQIALVHGTRGAYNRGCRCERCSEANRVHARNTYRKQAGA